MTLIDMRCSMSQCSHIKTVYRMVGRCGNCATEDILFLITSGHEAPKSSFLGEKCPVCGCRSAYAQRLATPDEVPAA